VSGATEADQNSGIGLLNEGTLHAGLKDWYAQPGDRFEVPVDGYVVDIVRGELLIEIQTGSFFPLKRKLRDLAERHAVRLVCPIAHEKWIVKLPRDKRGKVSRRKSPKRGQIDELFIELVSFPTLIAADNFTLEVLLTQEEEVRKYSGKRRWRQRGWVTQDRRLLDVVERRTFSRPGDVRALIPQGLPPQFTTLDLARAMDRPRWLAQKAAYCLRELGQIVQVGRDKRSYLYTWVDPD
jgi:hypothetical protein